MRKNCSKNKGITLERWGAFGRVLRASKALVGRTALRKHTHRVAVGCIKRCEHPLEPCQSPRIHATDTGLIDEADVGGFPSSVAKISDNPSVCGQSLLNGGGPEGLIKRGLPCFNGGF